MSKCCLFFQFEFQKHLVVYVWDGRYCIYCLRAIKKFIASQIERFLITNTTVLSTSKCPEARGYIKKHVDKGWNWVKIGRSLIFWYTPTPQHYTNGQGESLNSLQLETGLEDTCWEEKQGNFGQSCSIWWSLCLFLRVLQKNMTLEKNAAFPQSAYFRTYEQAQPESW